MQIIILTMLCALFYAMFEVFAGLAASKIDSWLAAVLYNGIGTVIPLVVYLSVTTRGKTTARGIIYAGLAGVAIMLFSVILARLFNSGGNLSFVIPAVYGSAIVLSSLYGWVFLKDRVTSLQAMGVAFIVAGVVLVILAKLKTA